MDIETAIAGVLQERSALQQPEGLSSPTYISEHMQALAQFNSALEECVGNERKRVEVLEADLFKKYTGAGDTVNKAQTKIKYELAADIAELSRLASLCTSSWRFISVSQSRINHLLAEAKNQI
jgi:hypothetical protein